MKIAKIFSSKKTNLVNIHKDGIFSETAKQLELSKGVLENYAKHRNIKVDIYSGKHALAEDAVAPVLEEVYANRLQVVVTDMDTQKDKFKLVSSDAKEIVKNSNWKFRMINNSMDGTQRMEYVKSDYEDNLARRIYRAVDCLVQSVKNKK